MIYFSDDRFSYGFAKASIDGLQGEVHLLAAYNQRRSQGQYIAHGDLERQPFVQTAVFKDIFHKVGGGCFTLLILYHFHPDKKSPASDVTDDGMNGL